MQFATTCASLSPVSISCNVLSMPAGHCVSGSTHCMPVYALRQCASWKHQPHVLDSFARLTSIADGRLIQVVHLEHTQHGCAPDVWVRIPQALLDWGHLRRYRKLVRPASSSACSARLHSWRGVALPEQDQRVHRRSCQHGRGNAAQHSRSAGGCSRCTR